MGCKAHKRRRRQFGLDIRLYLILFLAGETWGSQLPALNQGDPRPSRLWSSQGGLYIDIATRVCYWQLGLGLTLGIESCPAAGRFQELDSILELPGAEVQGGKVSSKHQAIFGCL